ncbi:hypothetical protein Tco_0974493 [Tanacetum coccineum]|uniref:Xylulose kinase-1 n=1 Tax=Tanacetum coccineum TaxID=301880 RepID=A0ABQ5EBU5_9ASTR
MTTLPFANTHNLVAFLDKPTESEGFEQIVDFLNASSIRYALTINPTIYTSCIQQFWATVKVKTVNGEVQLQALVGGKKEIITKTSVRRDLQLEDAEGIACLPNADIFEQLALMGYEKPSQKLTFYKAFFSPQWKFLIHTILQCLSAKSTAWKEFSSTMASAIICLATNQKFNFSKYIFESMVKNVDSSVKFLMYLRFVQVFLDKQVGDMSTHDEIFVTPSHTKKVFGNMKRVGKGFSGAVTPLFPTMMFQAQEEMGEEPIADEVTNEENVPTHSNDPLLNGEDSLKLNDFLKLRVKRLEKKGGSRTHMLKRLFKVGRSAQVVSSEDEGLGDQEDVSKQGRKIDDINKDAEVTLVDETQGRYGDDLVVFFQEIITILVSLGSKFQARKVFIRTKDVCFLRKDEDEEVEEASSSWDNVQSHDRRLIEKSFTYTMQQITDMLNKKLKSDYWNEICYQLLKLMTKHLKK